MVGTRLIACTNLYVQSVTFYNVHAILLCFCVEDSYTTKACNAGYIYYVYMYVYCCLLQTFICKKMLTFMQSFMTSNPGACTVLQSKRANF